MERDRTDLTESASVGVLVLGASAGGLPAVMDILRDLPLDFDVPIVIVQHLPAEASTVSFYAERLPFTFQWVDQTSRLAPRMVLLCPPRSCIELLPDGSFRLDSCERGALDKQIDRLLRSVARSFGHRAIAVVLTGMGNDGAAGARELHDAGGCIVVQAESSAEYAEMPRSAIAAGAADLVVPLRDMAQVLLDLVAGAVRPKARSELDAIENIFGTAGDIAAIAREINWSRTPLGPVLGWPAELRTIVRIGAQSPHLSAVWWGPELVLIYNEAYRRFLGTSKHPAALGVSARETWREIWSDIGPKIEGVMKDGVAVEEQDFCLHIDRHGFVEEIFVNFAFSPIRDARGVVLGVHNTCWETTDKVVAERRLLALRVLAARSDGARAPREACEHVAAALAVHPRDLPFGLLYLFDTHRRQASLAGAFGMAAGSVAAPHTVALVGARDTWALQRLVSGSRPLDAPGVLLEDLERRVPELASLVAAAPAGLVPRSVYVLPLRGSEDELPVGAFVAGLSPQRPFDDDYRSFVRFVAQQISASIGEALARQREHERLGRLAELDRAKTEFFANVSHEFRTPLTLLLSPLEEMQRRRDHLPSGLANEIDVAVRNSRRLLRLVDSLLDFSQIEQRRQRASIHPTDLASLTTDVASAFRSAIERAGLTLRVECAENLPLVPVDRDMWEKIVSNLLSNALKFTFEGEIVVRLRAMSLHAELVVSDTGIGIPKDELPNIFKRFHRVRGARARTIEGSGIGLAVVHDLVSRMYGQLQVSSTEGHGTTFTIWIPLKSFFKTFEPDTAVDTVTGAPRIAAGIAEEAATWLEPRANALALDDVLGAPRGEHLRLASGARILVADDNVDLRDYLRRLLGAYWKVTAVADGAEALAAARAQAFDLVLADVMMPNMDGFALLRAIREDKALKQTPVIFLTARAGEDTAIQGLLAGADDYLAKPFSARELIARVGGQIELTRARRRTQELNEFLVRFSDAVRGLSDPQAVADTACRMLMEQLGVDRAYWVEVDRATREYVIAVGARSPGVPAVEGRFSMDDWDPFSSPNRERFSHVVEDMRSDARIPAPVKESAERFGVGAELAAPVFVDSELHAVLAASQRAARRWTADEIALVEAVAGRCWPEVERARAESALRQADKRYRAMTDNAPVLIWETDASGLVFCNRHYTDFFGAPLEAVRGMGWASFLHPDDVDAYSAVYRSAFERRESYSSECRLRRADGEYRWLFNTGHPLGEGRFVGFSADITEKKRAEASLRTSEERKAFLLKLGDALTPLRDPSEIKATASRLLGEHLGIARAFFAEIDGDDWIVGDVYDDDASSLEPGRYPAAAYGRWTMDTLRAGGVVAVGDTATAARLEPSERNALRRIGNAAVVGVPLLRHGEVVAVLSLHSRERREWTNAELELVREIANRTWPAVERARVEEALKRSEERLLSVAESGVVAIAFFDATGAITDANDTFLEMVGHSRAELEGGNVRWDRLTPPEWMPQTRRAVEQYQATGRIEPYEKEYFRHNGERFWGLFAGRRLEATGEGVAIVLDITERKRVEADLRKSEGRLTAAFQSVPVGIAVIDTSGAVTFANPEYRRFIPSGMVASRDEANVKRWRAWDPQGRLLEPQEFPAARALRGESVVPGQECLYTDPDGREFWTNVTCAPTRDEMGRVTGCVSVISDVTERKAAAAAVRESEERLRRVLEGMGEGFGLLAPDFTILEHNREALRTDGRPREEIVGRSHWDAFPGSESSELGHLLKKAMAERVPVSLEHQYAWEEERALWLEMRAYPTSDGSLAVFSRDVTARREAQDALRESEARHRALFESIDEGYLVSEVVLNERGEPVDLLFVQANPAAIRLAGRDFTGQRLREVDPEYEQYWIDMHAHVAQTGEPVQGVRYAAPHRRWFAFHASHINGPGIRRVAVVYQDVTERKQREERQAFLLMLSDALRPLSDASEIETAACRLLGELLGSQRAFYVDIDEAAGVAKVERQYLREGATSSVGIHALADFSWSLAPMRRGEAIVVDDIRLSDLVPAADVAAMEAVQVVAMVAVPLVKGGVLVGSLCVSEAVHRTWKPDEVDLVRETLERTWAAAQHARAEELLRQSEAKYRALFGSISRQ